MQFNPKASALRPARQVSEERRFAFSALIVWDALIDADLADGWLGHLIVEPVPGGRYAIVWPTSEPHDADWYGTISVAREAELLEVRFPPHTTVTFLIETKPGGSEPGSLLSVLHESFLTRQEAEQVASFWRGRLELLEGLLRGHPVDWQGANHFR